MTVLIWSIFLGLTACSNYSRDKSATETIISDHSLPNNSFETDSLRKQNDELTKIYTEAIAVFIEAAYKKDRITFDTLYFGKHVYGQADDFPDIELPQIIDKTQIRLVSPEFGQKIQAERKSLVYVNMMGWIEKEKAEFLLVVFSNGAEHQYDYIINFIYNTSTNKFDLDKIEFENYLQLKGQKPNRITIYKDGKYFTDK